MARQESAMIVWALIAVGLAFDVLPRARLSSITAIPVGGLFVLAAFTAMAFDWTESDGRTFDELTRLIGYSGYVVLPYLGLNRYTWQGAAWGLVTVALLVPFLSLLARLSPDTITDQAALVFKTDRLSYPFGYWNALACWSSMAIAIGLTLSGHAKHVELRAITLAAVPVATVVTYMTYSRAGVIAVCVAVVAAMALSRNRWTVTLHAGAAGVGSALAILAVRGEPEIARATGSDGSGTVFLAVLGAIGICLAAAWGTSWARTDRLRLSRESARVAVPAGVALVLVAVILVGGPRIGDAWDQFRNEEAAPAGSDPAARLTTLGGSRYDTWSSAVDAFQQETARGIGPGTFEFWWSRNGGQPVYLRDAHSLYLESLAELGVVGLALILSVLGGVAVVAVVARRQLERVAELGLSAALLAGFTVFVVYAGVDWIWEFPALVLLGLAGAAVAGAAGSQRWGARELGMPVRLGAIGAAVVLVAVQVSSLVSYERLQASAAELRSDELENAARDAEDSVRAEPWSASPYVQQALVFEAEGNLKAAQADLEEAVRREPTNWRHPLLLARVAARRGDAALVRAQLADAHRLAPNSSYLVPGSPFLAQLIALQKESSAR